MSTLLFLFWLCILFEEGSLIARFFMGRMKHGQLSSALALPIAAISNAFIVFIMTVAKVPLTLPYVLILHVAIIAVFLYLIWKKHRNKPQPEELRTNVIWTLPTYARILCVILLAVQVLFSFTHSVILPTYQIDSLTNWTMRSKVSFYDRTIAFDPTEARGVAKPQYPILFHALQITVNEGNTNWSDRAANSILFLLSVSSFAALYLMIRKKAGGDYALLTMTGLFGIPLLSYLLTQGYADILLLQFLLLMIGCLWRWKTDGTDRWLLFSGLFAVCTVWTKSEGLIIGLFLWLLYFGYQWVLSVKKPHYGIAVLTLLFSLPYPIFLLINGMGLTPHASDTSFGFHADAVATALSGLFASGSMGVTWPIIAIAALAMFFAHRKESRVIHTSSLSLGWFGLLSLVIILFTYIFTPNAVFLVNGESYFRQLMIPAAELILWCMLVFAPRPSQS